MPNTNALLSPFLFSNFRPVEQQTVADKLSIDGILPQEISGIYLRAGPNPRFAPAAPYHWFDGDGMTHLINLSPPAQASYRNQYVQTAALEADLRAGKAVNFGLRHPPNITPTMQGEMPYRNTANTSILHHHGRTFALCEFGEPYELSLPEVKTLGRVTLGAPTGMTFNAHPKIDPITGELLYLRHRPASAPYLACGSLDPEGMLLYEVEIDTSRPCMMHDFVFTSSYIVILEQSPYFDLERAKAGEPAWVDKPDLPCRFGVIARNAPSSTPRWLEIASGCVTHFANAYESDGQIVISGIRYSRQPDTLSFSATEEDSSGAGEAANASLYEWRIDLHHDRVEERILLDDGVEFPAIHSSHSGEYCRYIYLAKEGRNSALMKFDNQTGKAESYFYGRGRYGGEATFIPRHNANQEDDGYLLVMVWDSRTGLSELMVLDAGNLLAEPVARIFLPVRVPFGFHGAFIPASALK